jgi:hypothetical protein
LDGSLEPSTSSQSFRHPSFTVPSTDVKLGIGGRWRRDRLLVSDECFRTPFFHPSSPIGLSKGLSEVSYLLPRWHESVEPLLGSCTLFLRFLRLVTKFLCRAYIYNRFTVTVRRVPVSTLELTLYFYSLLALGLSLVLFNLTSDRQAYLQFVWLNDWMTSVLGSGW